MLIMFVFVGSFVTSTKICVFSSKYIIYNIFKYSFKDEQEFVRVVWKLLMWVNVFWTYVKRANVHT